jgi:hypothetical protein
MLPVAYHADERAERELKLVTTNIKDNQKFLRSIDREMLVQSIYFMLMTSVVCLKHEGFHEEREWRIIYSPNQRPSRQVTLFIVKAMLAIPLSLMLIGSIWLLWVIITL